MVPYVAPTEDMRFVLEHVIGMSRLQSLPGFEDWGADTIQAVLDEAAKLATNVLSPINAVGDRQHAKLTEPGVVKLPEGFKAAYDQYRDGGWNALPFDPDYGGQGLPWSVAFAVQEMWQGSNMSFGLCPMLNQGAVELLQEHGSDAQKQMYLEKLISGVWTGTMNLTEPQAGSDLATVRTTATPDPSAGEGAFRIKGQKIYITFGEHDLAENIIHMVLARTPDAPEGTKGISLFIVPKFLVDEDGSLGARNDVQCVSLESKMGINASPTCTMMYGDESDGAIGYLIGNEREGLKLMFTMMNNARLAVGLQGVAVAQLAYGQAVAHAKDRVQSKHVARPKEGSVRIIEHADVRRMLLLMKSQIEAGRALTYYAAYCMDIAKRHPDRAEQGKAQAMVDLLTPIVKTWGTDLGCDVSSLGVQVHGGMGYVEEAGASQTFRDARIAPIYEGTNGIQANDLVFRKVVRDGGQAMANLISEVRETAQALESASDERLVSIQPRLVEACDALDEATKWVLDNAEAPDQLAASAYPYLNLAATVAGGWMIARSALAALDDAVPESFRGPKIATARFYAQHYLPKARGYVPAVTDGWDATLGLDEEGF
jgi:alkylation response protein AidB-like acyl-CoA dehydrogenase